MTAYTHFDSPLGTLTILSRNGSITRLWLPGQQVTLPDNAQRSDTPELLSACQWLTQYFSGEVPQIQISLSVEGTAFQTSVWALLKTIPYGTSASYGELAKRMGANMSAQAVGQAVGKNPIPILIPCHRVLGKGGKLTGYAGGIAAKTVLLDLEEIPYI